MYDIPLFYKLTSLSFRNNSFHLVSTDLTSCSKANFHYFVLSINIYSKNIE